MNKLGMAIGVVVIAGLAAVPYVSGMMIEQSISGTKALPGMGQSVIWSVDSFQRGYLSSTATSHLTIVTPAERVVLHFKQEISQVPGLDGRYASIRSTWVPDAAMKPDIDKLFAGKQPLVLNTALTIFGGSHTQGVIAPVVAEGLNFSGGTVTIDTASSGHFAYGMAIDGLSAIDPEEAVQSPVPVIFKGVNLAADGQMSAHDVVWDSQAVLKVASVSKGQEGSLSGLGLTMKSQRTGDDYAVNMGFDVAHAEFPDAPESTRDIKDMKFNFSLSRLDAPAVEQIYQQAQQAQKQGMTDPDQLTQAMTMTMMSQLPALLNRGPKFAINPISFNLPAGEVTLDFSAELPPGHGSEGMSNPMSLLTLLDMKGDFSVPEAALNIALNQAGQAADETQLNQMIQKGYVLRSNGMLKTKFAFNTGHLTINDKPADDLLGTLGALAPR